MTNELDLVDFTRAFFGCLSDINLLANDAEIQRQYEHKDSFSQWLKENGYTTEIAVRKEAANEGVRSETNNDRADDV